MNKFNVAIIGATGAVGQEMLRTLHERKFPINNLYAVASAHSLGQKVRFGTKTIEVVALDDFDFSKVDIGLFSAGATISNKYAESAGSLDCVVIDNTSAFRQELDIPLIIPEVNPGAIKDFPKRNIIANPNCSTIQMLLALKPLHDFSSIRRVIVTTLQSVSGSGNKAITELRQQSQQILNGEAVEPTVYSKQIAFNVLPQIDVFTENDFTSEELKMHNETRKILNDNVINITATATRVPVFYGHSESILIETEQPISPDKARELLSKAPGIQVIDDPKKQIYPTAVDHAAGKDIVSVGRIRTDLSNPNGLWLWVVGDNLKKGAALNSVQIAELLLQNGLQAK